jgi:hypothetical protein
MMLKLITPHDQSSRFWVSAEKELQTDYPIQGCAVGFFVYRKCGASRPGREFNFRQTPTGEDCHSPRSWIDVDPVAQKIPNGIWSLEDRMNIHQQVGSRRARFCLVIVAAIAFGATVVGEREAHNGTLGSRVRACRPTR